MFISDLDTARKGHSPLKEAHDAGHRVGDKPGEPEPSMAAGQTPLWIGRRSY